MSFGKLHGRIGNPRFSKVMVTAAYSGVSLETSEGFQMGKTNREPEYLAKFPLGQIPGLETADGKILTESSAISQYVAEQKENNTLLGANPWERALIQKFILFSEAQLMPKSLEILYMIWGIADKDTQVALKAYERLDILWADLDRQLKDKHFLVGERLTLADIDVICILAGCFKFLMYPEIRSKYPELVRYFKSIIFLPHFQACFTQLKSEEEFAAAVPAFMK
ncbi:hypothetical protein DSO57_1000048 [Entomophthora muscae]|uniref:Uncharacterized protein n=1 Tax=Entomophthora muscae TaxID=34485 RepID=A0ACC2SM86_9FUNG|nr:hypothetical protein DSO57_1000048 [Entomophthora muscae]